MLTVGKVFTILCLLCLCGNSVAFKTNQQVLLSNECPSEVRVKDFLKWTRIELSYKLSLTYEANATYYTSVHHLIPTLPVGTCNTLAIFKTNQ